MRRDPLTGVANRLVLDECLGRRLEEFTLDAVPFAVLFLDVDAFKQVNDRHGHTAGDALLLRIAETLLRESESYDLVARYGGDEFLIVRPRCDAASVSQHAERLRQAIESACRHDAITVSIGAAVVQPGDSVDSLLNRADTALYRAKSAGRNCTRS